MHVCASILQRCIIARLPCVLLQNPSSSHLLHARCGGWRLGAVLSIGRWGRHGCQLGIRQVFVGLRVEPGGGGNHALQTLLQLGSLLVLLQVVAWT